MIVVVYSTYSFFFRFPCVVSFFRFNRLRPILYRFSGLILSSFKGNIIFMLASGSLKMLKVYIELIV